MLPPTGDSYLLWFQTVWRGVATNLDPWLWRWLGMCIAIEPGRQTENERKKHEANGPFLFRRKDENLAACPRWWGRL